MKSEKETEADFLMKQLPVSMHGRFMKLIAADKIPEPSRLEIAARIASGIVSGDSTTLTCKTEGGVRGVNISYAYDFSKIARNSLKLTDELIRQEAGTSQKQTATNQTEAK